jgi:hypothetical protein
MAYFSELDENNVVTRVVVLDEKDCSDFSGERNEDLGIFFCKKLFGINTNWKETKKDGSLRVRYGGIGSTYDPQLDAFILPKPFNSWTLDEQTLDWVSPLGEKPAKNYFWDEDLYQSDNTQGWVLIS